MTADRPSLERLKYAAANLSFMCAPPMRVHSLAFVYDLGLQPRGRWRSRIGKTLFLAAIYFTAACVPTQPQPNVALDQITAACKAGDTQACAYLLSYQEQRRAAQAAAIAPVQTDLAQTYGSTQRPRQPAPVATPLTATQKVCPGGYIVGTYDFC